MALDLKQEHEKLMTEAKALAEKHGALEAEFLERFFIQGDMEDISRYSAEELASIAHRSFEKFHKSFEKKHRIDIFDPVFKDNKEAASNQITIIELHNINKPFLVDSIMGELQQAGLGIQLVLHPIMNVERDADDKVIAFKERKDVQTNPALKRESLIHVHISRMSGSDKKKELQKTLDTILDDVDSVVEDWKPMLLRLEETIAILKITPPPLPEGDVSETVEFLRWLVDNNFTLLGMREYSFDGTLAEGDLVRTERAGLGLLRNPEVRVLRRGNELVTMTPEIRDFLMRPEPLFITKANVKTKVHRRTYMDYIGIKRYDDDGKLTGELRIVGLFTNTAYNRSVMNIPFLRRKVESIIDMAAVDPSGHSGKAMLNVLENYPRDELFQTDSETLLYHSQEILRLHQRPKVRVLSRVDKFNRFVSCLVFVPRNRYNTEARIEIGNFLKDIYEGRLSAVYPEFPDGPLARVHFIIGRSGENTPNPSRTVMEDAINGIVRTWVDSLCEVVKVQHPIKTATRLIERYCVAFSDAYRDTFKPEAAMGDIAIMEGMDGINDTAIRFYRKDHEEDHRVTLKIFHQGNPIPLSERVPILENMGFRVIDERSYEIAPLDSNRKYWLHDMDLERANGKPIPFKDVRDDLEACFLAVWTGEAENDGYNKLSMAADLPWRDITILRTISRYLRQVRIPYDQDYMWETLNTYPELAALIVHLFHVRFDPAQKKREEECTRISNGILTALERVSNLDDDRILRKFHGVIHATLRTNFFQRTADGDYKPALAIKLDPRAMEDMPEPKPFREIFVYSPRVEGLHLRFGKVARGGLRWSDRPQDFRTEVLGLVKAQQVKNAVIVPVGSQGWLRAKTSANRRRQRSLYGRGHCLLQIVHQLAA